MDIHLGHMHFWTPRFEDKKQGCECLKLHREMFGKSEVVAQATFWDATGGFVFGTLKRTVGLVFALSVLMAGTAVAGTLSDAEILRLRSEIGSMTAAFEQGNAEEIINRTHPSLYALVGGKGAFAKATREAVEQLRQSGVKFISSEIGIPTQTFPAGAEEVCFVPRVSVMEVQGKRLQSSSFMIAIRRVGDSDWKYLDGAGLRKHPDFLSRLLPDLDPGVKYPENKIVEL